jgi:cysteine desulfuration protein SufE
MKIKEIQDEIVDEFSMFDDWMERYEYIIQLGKSLPLIKDEFKTDSNVIKAASQKYGCKEKNDQKSFSPQTVTRFYERNYRNFDSYFSNQTLIYSEADMGFIDAIGLKEHLSPTRANGLVSMIKNKNVALAFESQN